MITILLNTTNYIGEAVLDLQQRHNYLLTRHITVINALPAIGAEITDTEKMSELVNEGRNITKEFWVEAHNYGEQEKSALYPGTESIPVKLAKIFSDVPGIRIYCSPTARTGTRSFRDLKVGKSDLPDPDLFDFVTEILSVVYRAITDSFARWWVIAYCILIFVLLGVMTLVLDLLDPITGISRAIRRLLFGADALGWDWLLARIIFALAIIFAARLWAFWIWARTQRTDFPRD